MLIVPLLTYVGAQIRIYLPYTPVPITLQTFFIFLIAAYLPWTISTSGQLLYLVGGLIGLPFFANGLSGLYGILHPTGGYIFGFILFSFCISNLIKRMKNYSFLKVFLLLFMGNILLIYGLGVLRLSLSFGFLRSLQIGVLPFLFGDVIKIIVASLIINQWKLKHG